MKVFFTILLTFLFYQIGIPQTGIRDVSPDYRSVNTKTPVEQKGTSINGLSPYHTTPSWWFQRDRQVGGMAFGDYDSDGDLDLAVGCYSSQSYPPITEYDNFILRNNNGTLDTFPAWFTADSKTTTDIKWADIDKNGRVDLISANGNFQHSTIYFNSASGLSPSPGWTSNDNVWTVGAAICDVDGNGWLDLAFGNQGVGIDPNRPIQIFFNTNGTLSTNPGWSSADQMITNSVGFMDINKDNLLSIANLVYTASGTASSFIIPNTPVYRIDSIRVGNTITNDYCYDDLNGWISLGFVPTAGTQVKISYTYVSQGDMGAVKWYGFESGVYFNQNGLLNYMPQWNNTNTGTQKGIAWADFNMDGYMDLAMGGSGLPTYIYPNNNGVLSYTPIWNSSSTNTSCQELLAADVNKDGYPDLAAVHFGNSRVEIFFNIGGTLETTPSWTYTASSATAIAFGDVNGDGWLDLAVGTARTPVRLFIADPLLIPVELSSFTAAAHEKNVILDWKTSSEKNNSGFEIQRREKGKDQWESLSFIKGNGTSTEIHVYNFTDIPGKDGVFQYRLKQVDYDGKANYSRIAEAEILTKMDFNLGQNYPNPFNPSTRINYNIAEKCFVSIKLYDILGHEVKTLLEGEREKGTYTLNFDGRDLNSGVYLYRMTAANSVQVKKMMLLK